jgi:hypothetical protein
VKVEETFAKVVGRAPTEAERERLDRIGEGLGVHDNDALWAVVMALELYDSLYRKYPEQLAAETSKAIEGARSAFAAAAAAEAAKASAVLARQVARASVAVANRMAGRSIAMPWVAGAGATLVGYGAICLSVGVVLGSGTRPTWVRHGGGARGLDGVLDAVFGAPAGWMVFVLVVPAAAQGAWNEWEALREESEGPDRRARWARVALWGLALIGSVLLVLRWFVETVHEAR